MMLDSTVVCRRALGTCAVTRGAHVGARARSAPAFGAERVARGSDPAAKRAPGRAAPTPSAPSS